MNISTYQKIATFVALTASFFILSSCASKKTDAQQLLNTMQNSTTTKNTTTTATDTINYAYFGAGCFWCVEAQFELLDGVIEANSGYSGGHVKNPSYKDVTTGKTGHAEVIEVVYDPRKISYTELLEAFFVSHDPTTLNRQGADVGTQYRSAIFYVNDDQKNQANSIIQTLNTEKVYPDPVVTEVSPFDAFYPAEDYHQQYYELNKEQPYCRMVIQPKYDKFKKVFHSKLKNVSQ